MGELALVTGPCRLGVGDADEMPRACTVPDERVVVDVPRLVLPDGRVVHTLEGTGRHGGPSVACHGRSAPAADRHPDAPRTGPKSEVSGLGERASVDTG